MDPNTGYRYYANSQFHIIDRIKYLQSLGFSLPEIKEAIGAGRVEDLLPALEEHLAMTLEKIEEHRLMAEKLRWYIDYYRYLDKNAFPGVPFKRSLPERYLLAADCAPGDALYGPGGQRLTALQKETKFAKLEYLRQHGYVLDFPALMRGELVHKCYFLYLKHLPGIKHPAIRTLPAGEFLCFRGKPLIGEWDASLVQELMRDTPCSLVVAEEYEDNLQDFMSCTYEFQLLL